MDTRATSAGHPVCQTPRLASPIWVVSRSPEWHGLNSVTVHTSNGAPILASPRLRSAVTGPPPTSVPHSDEGLDDPSLYLNRELTWLEFNRRILAEAEAE